MDWLDFCWIDLNTKKKFEPFQCLYIKFEKDCNFLSSCTLPLSILSRQVWGHTSWTNALDPLTSSQGSTLAASRKTNTLPYLPVLQKIESKTPLDMQSYFIGCCGASWIKFDIKTFLKCMILPLLWEKHPSQKTLLSLRLVVVLWSRSLRFICGRREMVQEWKLR